MGPLLLVLSAACYGMQGVFGKLAYQAGVSPGALLLLRFTMGAALLAAIAVVRPGLRAFAPRSGSPRSRRRVLVSALVLGAIGYATPAGLYFSAIERIDVSLATLVFYTYPLFVTAAAAVLGRDRLTPARGAALVVASGGTLLVVLGARGLSFDLIGVALAFGAAVTYTVYLLVADRVVHRLPPLVLATTVLIGASLAFAVHAILTGGLDLGFAAAGWFWIVAVALVSTVVGMLAFLAGLRRTGPSTAAILSTVEPLVTAVLAAVALGELLTPVQLVGGLLVLSAIPVLQLAARPGRPVRSGVPLPSAPAAAGR